MSCYTYFLGTTFLGIMQFRPTADIAIDCCLFHIILMCWWTKWTFTIPVGAVLAFLWLCSHIQNSRLTYLVTCLLIYPTRPAVSYKSLDSTRPDPRNGRPDPWMSMISVTALTWRQRPVEVLRMRFSCNCDIRFQPNTPGLHIIIGDPSSEVDCRPLVHAAEQTSSSVRQNSVNKWASTPRCRMHVSAIVVFTHLYTYDLDLWPLTLKPFSAMPTHTVNICAKLNWIPSTKYRDIASREIGVNGQRTDDPKTQCLRHLLLAEP